MTDYLTDVPRGVGRRGDGRTSRADQQMPFARFMAPDEITSNPDLQFDGSKLFLGVTGARIEYREGLLGRPEAHALGGQPIGIGDD